MVWIKLTKNKDVWKLASQNTITFKYKPQGLSVSDKQLLVCDNHAIHVFSTKGQATGSIKVPSNVKPAKAVARLHVPGFVIMDDENNQVVLVNERGEVQQAARGFSW